MKKNLLYILIALAGLPSQAGAQSMHFSQYYNAPLLLNPANTALLPEHDYRIGSNYRNQWASVPVPYSTFSVYSDMQLMKSYEKFNCLGLGVAMFTDRAGDGQLGLTNASLALAYHLQMGQSSILSLGGSAAYVQRSINYDKMTYDFQWNGETFNANNPNGEGKNGILKTNYANVSVGLNYSYFSDKVFLKFSGGVGNVNQPKETFYSTGTNEIGMRPTGNVDLTLKLSSNIIVNPSIFYATQKDAYELMYGSLFRFNIQPGQDRPTQLILGGYHRMGDAVVGVMGLQWNDIQVMANYDHTMSQLAPYNNAKGALEFSIIYMGLYPSSPMNRKTLGCPRF
jgi:type IX secretion system PorP/SprF family membrane protein